MSGLQANRSNPLFIPEKSGGTVAQLAIQRYGQERPLPASTWLYRSAAATITSGGTQNIAWNMCQNDGNGINHFGTNTIYSFGAQITLGTGCWTWWLALITSVTAGDVWNAAVTALDSPSGIAMPFPFYTQKWEATAASAPTGALPTFAIPNIVVGGWYPASNGVSQTANLGIELTFYNPGGGTRSYSPDLVISRVS